jgi:hypothetical protein
MATHVNNFLSTLRRDFPIVYIEDIGDADVMACTERTRAGWNGDLGSYLPKGAVRLFFNHCVRHFYLLFLTFGRSVY